MTGLSTLHVPIGSQVVGFLVVDLSDLACSSAKHQSGTKGIRGGLLERRVPKIQLQNQQKKQVATAKDLFSDFLNEGQNMMIHVCSPMCDVFFLVQKFQQLQRYRDGQLGTNLEVTDLPMFFHPTGMAVPRKNV